MEMKVKNKFLLCRNYKRVSVLKSAIGYYIGTIDEDGPYCRISGYYKDEKSAWEDLRNNEFIERESSEVLMCNSTLHPCIPTDQKGMFKLASMKGLINSDAIK